MIDKEQSLELTIHAVVPAAPPSHEAAPRMAGAQVVTCGAISALASRPLGNVPPLDQALRHDRIVHRAVARFDAVVPFRAGAVLASELALQQFLQTNSLLLKAQLGRFSQKVEMGLKAALGDDARLAGDGAVLDPWLSTRLAALAVERRESLHAAGQGVLFDAIYLIHHTNIAQFWALLRQGQRRRLSVPIVGTGPWAPYGFCDFALSA